MMCGVEIDFVVSDCIQALETYKRIFEIETIEATSFPRGSNEAVFSLYGTRVHMLDENPEFELLAPQPGCSVPMWINVTVPDIRATWDRAMAAGCRQVQAVTPMPQMGVINAMFFDPFGYLWMLHQVERVVDFQERCRILGEQAAAQR